MSKILNLWLLLEAPNGTRYLVKNNESNLFGASITLRQRAELDLNSEFTISDDNETKSYKLLFRNLEREKCLEFEKENPNPLNMYFVLQNESKALLIICNKMTILKRPLLDSWNAMKLALKHILKFKSKDFGECNNYTKGFKNRTVRVFLEEEINCKGDSEFEETLNYFTDIDKLLREWINYKYFKPTEFYPFLSRFLNEQFAVHNLALGFIEKDRSLKFHAVPSSHIAQGSSPTTVHNVFESLINKMSNLSFPQSNLSYKSFLLWEYTKKTRTLKVFEMNEKYDQSKCYLLFKGDKKCVQKIEGKIWFCQRNKQRKTWTRGEMIKVIIFNILANKKPRSKAKPKAK